MTQIKVTNDTRTWAQFLTDKQYALLVEILSSRHAELLEDQQQGNDAQWLSEVIDELEELNYIIPFLSENDEPAEEVAIMARDSQENLLRHYDDTL